MDSNNYNDMMVEFPDRIDVPSILTHGTLVATDEVFDVEFGRFALEVWVDAYQRMEFVPYDEDSDFGGFWNRSENIPIKINDVYVAEVWVDDNKDEFTREQRDKVLTKIKNLLYLQL